MNGQQNIAPMQNFAILGQVQPKWPIFEVSRFIFTLFAEVSRALRMQITRNSIQDGPPMLIDLWVYQSAPYLHRGNILLLLMLSYIKNFEFRQLWYFTCTKKFYSSVPDQD